MSNNSGLLVIALISVIVISLFGAFTLTSSQVIDWTELTGIPTNLAYYPITVNASCPETFPYANLTGVPNFVVNSTSNLFMGQVYYNQVLNHPNSYPWANLTGTPTVSHIINLFEAVSPTVTYAGWTTDPTSLGNIYDGNRATFSTTAQDTSPSTSETTGNSEIKIDLGNTYFASSIYMKIGVWGTLNTSSMLLDNYAEGNYSTAFALKAVHPSSSISLSAAGQTFTTLNNGYYYGLTSCKFYIQAIGAPAGYIQAYLYAHTGTWGSSGIPTGLALATSIAINMNTIPTADFGLITFTFDGTYIMVPNTHYCIFCLVLNSTNIGSSNYLYDGVDGYSPTHSGNNFKYTSTGWAVQTGGYDVLFYVYGVGYASKTISVRMGSLGTLVDSQIGTYLFMNTTELGAEASMPYTLTLNATGDKFIRYLALRIYVGYSCTVNLRIYEIIIVGNSIIN